MSTTRVVAAVVGVEQDEDGRRADPACAGRRRSSGTLDPVGGDRHQRVERRRQRVGQGLETRRDDDRSASARRPPSRLVDQLAVVALATRRRQVERRGRRGHRPGRRPRPRSSAVRRASRRPPSATTVAPSVENTIVPDTRSASARDPVARPELAGDERPGQRVLDQPLDGPLERPRPERRVGALADDERLARRGQLERTGPARPAAARGPPAAGRRSPPGRRRSGRGRR